MATLILPYPAFTAGTPAVAAEVQDNFTTIRDHINGQNIGTANLESTLVSRVGGPILFLNQASQEQIALSILNSRTKSALQITQSAVLSAGSSIIHIDDNATQTTGDANLFLDLQPLSTIPAILVKHGAVETMSLTKTQLNLFNSTVHATNSTLSLFTNAVEFSNARIKLPVRTGAERDTVTQEGSILYNTTDKRVQYRTDTEWRDFTPSGVIQMFAGTSAPTGWLFCNGAVISQTTYATLFAVIGTTYNTTGEGAGNFRLPNFVGIFPRGCEMGGITTQDISGITYTGGSLNTKQADQMQGHIHNQTGTSTTNTDLGTIPKLQPADNKINSAYDTNVPKSDGTNGTPRTGTETRPANIAIAYIIKT
jgi:microcystin-dependent protein